MTVLFVYMDVSVMWSPRPAPHVFSLGNLSIHEVTSLQASSRSAVNVDWKLPPGIGLWNMRKGGGGEGTRRAGVVGGYGGGGGGRG